jgi:hypothetical protein
MNRPLALSILVAASLVVSQRQCAGITAPLQDPPTRRDDPGAEGTRGGDQVRPARQRAGLGGQYRRRHGGSPFNVFLRSPELGDSLQKAGTYIRFKSSLGCA